MQRKSTPSPIVLSPGLGARRVRLALLAGIFSFLLTSPLLGQNDDPSEIFLKAYLSAQQGERLEHENQFKGALAKFRFAGSLIEELRTAHSDWQPAIVQYRGRKIGEGILRIQERMSRQNELNAAASPLPDVVPSLPEDDAWTEPGPEVVAPQDVEIPRASNDAAIEDSTRKLRRKVDQLQAAIEKSHTDLESVQKEEEAIKARLAKTRSKLEDAQKEVETSKQSERQVRKELAKTQASLKTLQTSQANSTEEQLRVQISNLNNEVAVAEAAHVMAEKQKVQAEAKLVEPNKQIAEVPQQGDELVESQKRNQYLLARIAELEVQLDETGAQLQNAKLAGKNGAETTRLIRENEMLRNIVARERQEEARRDEARRLMLAELDKLKIKSDLLNREIEFLAQPVTRLSSEELNLLRRPVISVSDQSRGALTASFIFAKKSSDESIEVDKSDADKKPILERDATMSDFGGFKGDLQNFAPAARESFSDSGTGQQGLVLGNSD